MKKSILILAFGLLVVSTQTFDFGAVFHNGRVCLYSNSLCWGQNKPELSRYQKFMDLSDTEQDKMINGLKTAGFSETEIFINLLGY